MPGSAFLCIRVHVYKRKEADTVHAFIWTLLIRLQTISYMLIASNISVTMSRTRCAALFCFLGWLSLLPLLVYGVVVTGTPSWVHLHVLSSLMPCHVIILLLFFFAKGMPLHGREGEGRCVCVCVCVCVCARVGQGRTHYGMH